MRLYLDDDSASALLTRLLRQAGHHVRVPSELGMAGDDDAVHLRGRLKRLWRQVSNLPICGLLPFDGKLETCGRLLAAGVPIADHFHILNHWR